MRGGRESEYLSVEGSVVLIDGVDKIDLLDLHLFLAFLADIPLEDRVEEVLNLLLGYVHREVLHHDGVGGWVEEAHVEVFYVSVDKREDDEHSSHEDHRSEEIIPLSVELFVFIVLIHDYHESEEPHALDFALKVTD